MPDTRREKSTLQALMADNSAGDISAGDNRDGWETCHPSNVIQTAAYATGPTSPVTGDLFLPSDGFVVQRYNGSARIPWGPIFPLADPTLQSWSWTNQVSATVTSAGGGIYLQAPADTNGLRIRDKAAPTAPYTITALFQPNLHAANYHSGGILFRDSSSSKIISLGMKYEAAWNFDVIKFTNPTTFASRYTQQFTDGRPSPLFLRIVNDNTNLKFFYGTDGVNFTQLYSASKTDYLTTIDRVGFFADSNGASYTAGMNLISWQES